MTITQYQAWARPQRYENDIKQALSRLFADAADSSGWAPRVDILEEANRFVILADVPGIEPKDIEISMDKGVLSIKGERKSESTDESAKPSRIERQHGAFHRNFTLPDAADADSITAVGKNGVLEVSIPKKPQSTPRRIEITH